LANSAPRQRGVRGGAVVRAVGRVPPIAGLAQPDPSAATLRLARESMDAPGPIALVNSFAAVELCSAPCFAWRRC
jgi:hypothetical protein